MKAIVYTDYGSPDVLQLKEIERPTAANSDVLIKVRAAELKMIGRMIAPPAQMMLLGRPKFKFLRFKTTVNNERPRRESVTGWRMYSSRLVPTNAHPFPICDAVQILPPQCSMILWQVDRQGWRAVLADIGHLEN